MKRVVLDTNIFISATFWKGKPRQVVDVFAARRALLLLSEDILGELERKLTHKKFANELTESGLTIAAMMSDLRTLAEIVTPASVPTEEIRDPKDRIILACAVGGDADYIVSGDHDLTVLKAYGNIVILTPAQFLTTMGTSDHG
ncbi:MAG: putative toxin-antitoxin system toxin component, PIN family [Anaerolinea sp.]|nr:putative toxin-antitoxin system toxin component, PIN family [Anaerolinea sp.]